MSEKLEMKLGQQDLIIETGEMARQADGAVTVQYGGTVVLVTAVISDQPRENADFFPLFVEYQEKTYAAGRIPGGFFKREGRPTQKEILSARLIDRPIRPLFIKNIFNEVQVMAMVLSSDGENDPDVLAMVGASSALMLANIPFNDAPPFTMPIGALRVGRVEQKFIINPTYAQLEQSDLDLVIAATGEGVVMLEAEANELPEEVIVEAVNFAQKDLQNIIELQYQLQKKVKSLSKRGPRQLEPKTVASELLEQVKADSLKEIEQIFSISNTEKRQEKTQDLTKQLIEKLVNEESTFTKQDVKTALSEIIKHQMRKLILEKKVRVDKRKFTDIRPIDCKVGVLPRTHGSGLFTRGQTQSLAVTTLGSGSDEQMVESLEGKMYKNFMLHYSFPPFSVGEVRPVRGPGRREIGHGALAERSLKKVMPSKDEFPYTVRLVAETLESNGSSSMATVCAGTLSLMDAGVPIKAPVAGIAMGLVKEKDAFAVLTDILGLEDHFGDTDFKVTGTRAGITAMQVDLKIKGIDSQLVSQILTEANKARMTILDKIAALIDNPRSAISEYAPKIEVLKIATTKIGEVIGPGGKTIRGIIQKTGATIDIDDEGRVVITAEDAEGLQAAVDTVKGLTEDPEIGRIYDGKIKKITNFGAFCEYLPGKDGLIHVSEMADKFVKNVEDVVKLGQEVKVKLTEVDDQGRVKLSIKQAKSDDQTSADK
ncbi:MAG: polyribonucleotide nucleotidyltransferase [Candidatus Omnitrophica bacterium]|nr:polyribonucleotide nucleotidyltransferase [Candidatus Omnitrophota bacterium]